MLSQLRYTGFSLESILMLLMRVIVVLLAICVHETAHGFAAYKLGDPTAKRDGRLSLNPLRHIDPIGALCMFFFGFGWAKPVGVNPNYFKNYKRDMAITALAGPLSNIALAYIGMLFFVHVVQPIGNLYLGQFFALFILLNINFAVFNLIPIPPLDGSKIFLQFLPPKIYFEIMRYQQYGFIVLIAALYLNVLDPVINTCASIVLRVLTFLAGGGF